ncbi:MAG: CusA/CzcA family heavy metal efflux RND transporter [Parachlamydiales bacterium]|jgi:cobalt-zinc-cadmium resistance protein CzcA
MIEKILTFAIRNRVMIVLVTLLVALWGAYNLKNLPIDAVPDITNNQIQINTEKEGMSPVEVEKLITYPIENVLSSIPGLESTRSISRNGFSQVTAIFDEKVNIYFARQQINERLAEAKEFLPEGADPKMGPISTGLGEIYMWSVAYKHPRGEGAVKRDGRPGWQSDGSYLTPEGQPLRTEVELASYLRTVQDWIIRPQLMGVKGLAEIDAIGGYVRQYHVEADIHKMQSLGITFQDIVTALQHQNLSIGAGYIEHNQQSYVVKADHRINTPEMIKRVVITAKNGVPIRVEDVADVVIGKELRTGSATANGEEAVIGTAMMLIGANSRTVSQAVDERIQEINKTLPPDIQSVTQLNRTKLVDATIKTVSKNLAEGALLVIAVLFAMLGNFRAACIAALVIPLSMLITSIGMVQTKISGNLMSLGALDFGLIVDGAVIITENCLRHLSEKTHELGRRLSLKERLNEVTLAAKEMIQPTVYGQAIIIIVYFPLLTFADVEGKMFEPMALTVIYALIAAFILSITFVPAMIALLVRNPSHSGTNWVTQLGTKTYLPLLESSLKFPAIPVAATVAVVVASGFLFSTLGQEFVPSLDEKDLALHAIRIPSTSLSQSTEMQKAVEKMLLTFPEIDYVFSKTGTAEMATDPMPPNVSDTFVMLKDPSEWPDPYLSKADLIEKLEEKLFTLPGNNYEFTQPIEMRFNELIAGVSSDVAVKIYGDDYDQMQKTGNSILRTLKALPGTSDVKAGQVDGLPLLQMEVNEEAASRLGMHADDILEAVSIAIGGAKAGVIMEGDRRFDIVVKLPEEQRNDPIALADLPVALTTHSIENGVAFTPLKELIAIELTEGINEINRENGKRVHIVQANVRGMDLGTYVNAAKNAINSGVKIPSGYWISWGGQFENMLSARNHLLIVIPLSFLLIFMLLYSALHSVGQAILVFSGVPLALTGGIVTLWMRDMPFSISAAVGFIALSGIAVLNGLVMMSYINQLRRNGMPQIEAILKGAVTRLRPVLMTAFVASLGFVPMALATGTGAEVQKPLATVVIGGLLSSTLLTLFILPVLYKWFIKTLPTVEEA